MSKRKKFIKLYRKAAMLYLRANSYAHKFFYSKGFRPYDEIHPIEFTITPTAMTLDVSGTPKDVLNIVDGKVVIVNEFGDFTATMKATIPVETEYNIIEWSFQKELAGQLVDCDDTEVTFTPNPLDETECEFSIGTTQDEACRIVISASIKGDYGVIGNGIPVEIGFFDIPKLTIAPTALMFGGDDILDYDAETKTITVLDKLGVFTLDLEMTPLEGVDFDTLDWSYAKVVEGELANCDDTTVTFTKDAVEPLKKVAFTITTIANEACSVVIDATISKDSTIIETSHSIKIEFKETPTPPEPEPEP